MVSATIFKASGLPAYIFCNWACSSGEPMTSCAARSSAQSSAASPDSSRERTNVRRPSRARRAAGFSRLVSSRQL